MEERIVVGEGSLRYRLNGETAEITGCTGQNIRIEIPSRIEGYPVTCISRKAFLSQKDLYAAVLPESLGEIGDWAFANCTGLTEVSLPKREVRFERAVFKNCGSLKRIVVRECRQQEWERRESCVERKAACYAEPELLAAAVTHLDAYYLLELPVAGSPDWLGKWDTKLLSVLRTSDQEGYISQSVYGEEDYIGTDLEEYISERRKEKVRLAFLRLLHPRELSSALRGELEEYLRSLTKGLGGEETWQVLLAEHGEDRDYYRLFADLSCINEKNFDGILADMEGDHPEMKAFFLKFWEERHGAEDFFQGLEL